ncbi:MAG: hypothetical protein EXQ63_00490 [Ilumatobacteraceae bacterium]|nr:hypothetical protein [Ilumatobacteraceae bacterium]
MTNAAVRNTQKDNHMAAKKKVKPTKPTKPSEVINPADADNDPEELDALEIDPEILDDEDGEIDEEEFGDDVEGADDLDDDASMGATIVIHPGASDDDDEEDLTTPDDVEDDLSKILKEKLVATEDEVNEDEELEVDERGLADDHLQPKRDDEQLCSSCFLLVRSAAPICPVGDDDCPIFVSKNDE